VVNAFYILCYLPRVEQFVISILQNGLAIAQRRKFKHKRFFYFIDKVIKEMPDIREKFSACRVIITGKLSGGTGRTSVFSVGYGVFPLQGLSEKICFGFGSVYSKYGSFGMRLLTKRKE
jgi:hypothetical protein